MTQRHRTAQWVYVIAPLAGASVAALVYRWLRAASLAGTTTERHHQVAREAHDDDK